MTIRIPGRAIATEPPDHDDLESPIVALLRSLSLLPLSGDQADASGFTASFKGTPDSVAVLEAGATAASKWWATAMAGGVVASTGAITALWDTLGKSGTWNQPFAVLALGVVLGSAIIGIASLLGSDVRGRAAAMVATIEARRAVATSMLEQAGKTYMPDDSVLPQTVALPGYAASNISKAAASEPGWRAIALRERKDGTEYLLVKAGESEWVASNKVVFLDKPSERH
jgi:hypothetical protein